MFVRTLISYTRSINPLVTLSGLDVLSEHQHVCILKVILCCLTVLPDPNWFVGFFPLEIKFSYFFTLRREFPQETEKGYSPCNFKIIHLLILLSCLSY